MIQKRVVFFGFGLGKTTAFQEIKDNYDDFMAGYDLGITTMNIPEDDDRNIWFINGINYQRSDIEAPVISDVVVFVSHQRYYDRDQDINSARHSYPDANISVIYNAYRNDDEIDNYPYLFVGDVKLQAQELMRAILAI